jgi:hypothetical protein
VEKLRVLPDLKELMRGQAIAATKLETQLAKKLRAWLYGAEGVVTWAEDHVKTVNVDIIVRNRELTQELQSKNAKARELEKRRQTAPAKTNPNSAAVLRDLAKANAKIKQLGESLTKERAKIKKWLAEKADWEVNATEANDKKESAVAATMEKAETAYEILKDKSSTGTSTMASKIAELEPEAQKVPDLERQIVE